MITPDDLANASFVKSSHSSGEGQCVEVARVRHRRAVVTRDSKSPSGPVLVFPEDGWDGFLRGLDAGDFRP
mgnify:CR=1 FL=1